tara:strand:+ start:1629 stop:3500 length:1872 start_codon:yes stop_codon:yes gene_type:complete
MDSFKQHIDEAQALKFYNLLPKKVRHAINRFAHQDKYKGALAMYRELKKNKDIKQRKLPDSQIKGIAADFFKLSRREFDKILDRKTRYEAEEMVKLRKGNKEVKVPKHRVDFYLGQHYKIVEDLDLLATGDTTTSNASQENERVELNEGMSTAESTALETVLGVCYQAAAAKKRTDKEEILKAGMALKEFKTASKRWQQKGKDEKARQKEINNLLKFGKSIYDIVGGDGSFEFQGKGSITKDWADWSSKVKKDGTPKKDTSKTDIVLGGKRYSVKNANGAQLMSGKKGESIATAAAAANVTNMTDKALNKIKESMQKLEETTTKGYYASLDNLKILKDQGAPNQTLFDFATKEKAKYEKAMAKVTDDTPKKDYPKKPTAAILDIANNPQNAAKAKTTISGINASFLKDMEGVFQTNQDDVKKFLQAAFDKTAGYKKEFVFEAATGNQKFGNVVQRADYMLCWKPHNNIEKFKISTYPCKKSSDKIIGVYEDQVDLQVNWKSGSSAGHLGYNAYQNVRLSLQDTANEMEDAVNEQNKNFNTYTQLLTEGYISEGAFWDKVKEISNKFVDKAKALWNRFIMFFKVAIKKITDAANAGIESLGNVVGLEMSVIDNILNKSTFIIKL